MTDEHERAQERDCGGAVDVERFRETMREAGVEEIVEDALRIYRSELSGRMRRLWEALDLGNAKAVEAEAHALRSASLNVWAVAFAGHLDQVENAAVQADIDAARALMAPVTSELGRVAACLDQQLPQGS